MDMPEDGLKALNGWVSRVDGRLDKMTESMESLRLAIVKLEMMLASITDGQHQYLTASSFDHVKVVKDIADLDERVRELKRVSEERQSVVDSSKVYMVKVDEMEKSLGRVWRTFTWFAAAFGTIGIALVIKWLETIIVRPNLYKAAMLSLWGG